MYTLSPALLVIIGNSFQLVRCAPSVALLSCVPVGPRLVLLPSLYTRGPHSLGRLKQLQPQPINLNRSLGCATFVSCPSCTQTELRKSVNYTELSGNWAENSIAMFSIPPATANTWSCNVSLSLYFIVPSWKINYSIILFYSICLSIISKQNSGLLDCMVTVWTTRGTIV